MGERDLFCFEGAIEPGKSGLSSGHAMAGTACSTSCPCDSKDADLLSQDTVGGLEGEA